MSSDLVKQLRKGRDVLGEEAADRIEELEAKLAKAVEQLKKIAEHDMQKIALTGLRACWKDLAAHRLALTEIAKHDLQAIATSAIAELKGETDE